MSGPGSFFSLSDGSRCAVIPAHRLGDLKTELETFTGSTDLNGFQRWITTELYNLDLPETGFTARSIIAAAVPHPFYAPVRFTYDGRTHECLGLVMSDLEAAGALLARRLSGWSLVEAPNLPLKRLCVHAGLARYGRNNITYVEGLGSLFSLKAWFSDLPADGEAWAGVRLADRCASCSACVSACPTGAIVKDRFLIDNERCLSAMNEGGDPFPAWLDRDVHHTLYDCLRCQLACPMNRDRLALVAGMVELSEEETRLVMEGGPARDWPAGLVEKAGPLGLDQWPHAMARNLMAIVEKGTDRR
jgi:epoxyqueuosine reductase